MGNPGLLQELPDIAVMLPKEVKVNQATHWTAFTKAEIVKGTEERFGVNLEKDDRKAVLVEIAEKLGLESR
jgi:hypothetical protein